MYIITVIHVLFVHILRHFGLSVLLWIIILVNTPTLKGFVAGITAALSWLGEQPADLLWPRAQCLNAMARACRIIGTFGGLMLRFSVFCFSVCRMREGHGEGKGDSNRCERKRRGREGESRACL